MKYVKLYVVFVMAAVLAGCATVSKHDREVLRDHGVSQAVIDRMDYGDALSLEDIIELAHQGVPARLVVNYMEDEDLIYRLKKADVERLRKAGVSEEVIAYMISTGRRYYGPVGPYPYYYGPYPYDPYFNGFYGPGYFGPTVVVGGWGWNRGGGHDWGGHHHDH